MLYDGSIEETGNLKKCSDSVLAGQLMNKRLGRARINNLLKKKFRVERYDLITMLFFIYAEEIEAEWPDERYLQFLDEINGILTNCGMMEIYPANPLEAFVLLCLLTEYPLFSFSEVWAMSYVEEDES